MAIISLAGVAIKVLSGPIVSVLDKFVDDRQLRTKLEAEFQNSLLEFLKAEEGQQQAVILGEASSEHWLTANWRPLLMVLLMGFLLLVGLLIPLGDLITGRPLAYEPRWQKLPPGFWDFLSIGVGGYIGGRSLEKIATQWTKS